jgi:hypothetical protein
MTGAVKLQGDKRGRVGVKRGAGRARYKASDPKEAGAQRSCDPRAPLSLLPITSALPDFYAALALRARR